uniref:Lipoprotein n=1 Tax=Haemonchus contortus TaxID=6289 RepID=A0A7I4Y2I2_HAECO
MLGMMNSPADTVEFYAARRSGTEDDDGLKAFTEVKQKRSVTYMQDGRRMIDGKIEPGSSETAMSLWETTLRRGAITTQMMPTADNGDQPAGEGSECQAKGGCPETTECSNPVMVYAPNRRHGEGLNEEHLKSFTEVKPRQTVTYTKGQYNLVTKIRRMTL